MQTSPSRGGAGVSARTVTPALELATLTELLAKAIGSDSQASPTAPLVHLLDNKVVLNLREPLLRLVRMPQFQEAFSPGDDTGYMRDITVPPRGVNARIGGRLFHGTEAKTATSLQKLHAVVAEEVAACLKDTDISKLTLPTMDAAMKAWADSINESKPIAAKTAFMVPVVFGATDRRQDERSKDIGRVLTAIETVDGKDSLEALLKGIANQMRKDGLDDEVEDTLEAIRARKNLPGSLTREFVDFLEDEALARVRLQVTMRLMAAIAAQSGSVVLQQYVDNVQKCFDLFGGIDGEALTLDVSQTFGQASSSNLADHLQKAMFYNCLSVWAQWSVQLFETRTEPSQGFATVREVSYRFRVNGNNPMSGKSAFATRLDRLQEKLLEAPSPDKFVKRDVAELVFLNLVLPETTANPVAIDVLARAKSIAVALKANPLQTLTKLHAELRSRMAVFEVIADELIDVLKSKSNKVVSLAGSTVDSFTVSIHRSIVDWEAVSSMTSNTEILKRADKGDNSTEWFRYLTISNQSVVPGTVASYTVKTELKERALSVVANPVSMAFERDLSGPVLPVRFVPYHQPKGTTDWLPHLPNASYFDAKAGIELQYDLRLLQVKRTGDEKERGRSEQFRAASVTAFTVLAYVVLWELQAKVRSLLPETGMVMIRLQHTGRQADRAADADDANTAVYAASQAIEKALSREGFTKLQGVTTQVEGNSDNLRWRRRGALAALQGGHAMRFPFDGSLDKVALITYVTRPCDEHPAHQDADGYLFMSRTFVADRSPKSATIKTLRMRSRLVENRKEFKNPQPILEEIARLHTEGYRHVMLLSHHFGNRHIGRAAERHAPHGSLEFLDTALHKFKDMNLYTLRRDVFPATRLRKRDGNESAFEVLNFKDHQAMYDSVSDTVLRSIVPIYTFATLAVVGDEGDRPQSGFCTYFFDGEQRISNIEARETVRQNIIGIGDQRAEIRQSLVSVLRAVHFLESEKGPVKNAPAQAVLDPFGWVNPVKRAAAGEIEVMNRRRGGAVLLSLPAVLAHVTKVLHKESQ
jgi:hypothetical protein